MANLRLYRLTNRFLEIKNSKCKKLDEKVTFNRLEIDNATNGVVNITNFGINNESYDNKIVEGKSILNKNNNPNNNSNNNINNSSNPILPNNLNIISNNYNPPNKLTKHSKPSNPNSIYIKSQKINTENSLMKEIRNKLSNYDLTKSMYKNSKTLIKSAFTDLGDNQKIYLTEHDHDKINFYDQQSDQFNQTQKEKGNRNSITSEKGDREDKVLGSLCTVNINANILAEEPNVLLITDINNPNKLSLSNNKIIMSSDKDKKSIVHNSVININNISNTNITNNINKITNVITPFEDLMMKKLNGDIKMLNDQKKENDAFINSFFLKNDDTQITSFASENSLPNLNSLENLNKKQFDNVKYEKVLDEKLNKVITKKKKYISDKGKLNYNISYLFVSSKSKLQKNVYIKNDNQSSNMINPLNGNTSNSSNATFYIDKVEQKLKNQAMKELLRKQQSLNIIFESFINKKNQFPIRKNKFLKNHTIKSKSDINIIGANLSSNILPVLK